MKRLFFTIPFFISSCFAAVYDIPMHSDVVGHVVTVHSGKGDRLATIAKDYEIGILEMQRANPTRSHKKRLKAGTSVVIPSQYVLPPKMFRDGIVINMTELRLYYFPKGKHIVYTYPVAMGRSGWRTPTKTTFVKSKTKSPTWHVPDSIRIHALDTTGRILPETIPPGPKNPLGKYAIYLKERGILIHGTNNPSSIGQLVSSGCIRMFNSNVKELYHMVQKNTPVHIIHHANKVGINAKGHVLLESHPPVHAIDTNKPHDYLNLDEKLAWLKILKNAQIHDNSVASSQLNAHGVPSPIGFTAK